MFSLFKKAKILIWHTAYCGWRILLFWGDRVIDKVNLDRGRGLGSQRKGGYGVGHWMIIIVWDGSRMMFYLNMMWALAIQKNCYQFGWHSCCCNAWVIDFWEGVGGQGSQSQEIFWMGSWGWFKPFFQSINLWCWGMVVLIN